jgi:hypothetical protein
MLLNISSAPTGTNDAKVQTCWTVPQWQAAPIRLPGRQHSEGSSEKDEVVTMMQSKVMVPWVIGSHIHPAYGMGSRASRDVLRSGWATSATSRRWTFGTAE